MDKQPWKCEFYENHLKYGERIPIEYNDKFMESAFTWLKTEQGGKYWDKIDLEYLKWYSSTDKPKSWEEYCDMDNPVLKSRIQLTVYTEKKREYLKCGMPDKLCEAFAAYAKLMQLRNAWEKNDKALPRMYKILVIGDSIKVYAYANTVEGISFSSIVTAKEFMSTFKDLLEEAKPLL